MINTRELPYAIWPNCFENSLYAKNNPLKDEFFVDKLIQYINVILCEIMNADITISCGTQSIDSSIPANGWSA